MHQAQELGCERCPHCQVAKPKLTKAWVQETNNSSGGNKRWWALYLCSSCGGAVLTVVNGPNSKAEITAIWPTVEVVPDELPQRAKEYLEQAISSLAAPAGAVILAASSVDSMLKAKGLTSGTLNTRIDEAAKTHLITTDMAAWAHEIRLEANSQRHADDTGPLPGLVDAQRAIEFAQALAEFMFVLPAKVQHGRQAASPGASK